MIKNLKAFDSELKALLNRRVILDNINENTLAYIEILVKEHEFVPTLFDEKVRLNDFLKVVQKDTPLLYVYQVLEYVLDRELNYSYPTFINASVENHTLRYRIKNEIERDLRLLIHNMFICDIIDRSLIVKSTE